MSALLVLLVRGYQYTLRPFIGAHCRYEPTCSEYAVSALRAHGPARGTRLAAGRVLRCNPWGQGGYDPVPAPRSSHGCGCHSPAKAMSS